MGLIGDAINWVKEKIFGKSQPEPAKTNDVTNGSGGGYSSAPSHIYNYEPDKLRIAEIERQTKLELADKETERIELMRDAKIELLKAQAVTQAAIEKARAEGMREMTQQLIDLQKEMLEVAEKRIVIIEKCALPIIRDIENFYNQIGEKIQQNGDDYNTKKLPQLLETLNKYEKGSTAFEIYAAQINEDRMRQSRFIEEQLRQVNIRQNTVLQSFLISKEKIVEQTGQITQTIADKLLTQKFEVLPSAENDSSKLLTLSGVDIKSLPPSS